MIQDYSFGKIKINNKNYNKDLIILKEKIIDNWWREKGHLLQLKDTDNILNIEPEIIIIGTGFFGFMKVSREVIEELNKKGINYYIEKTGKAVKIYNDLIEKFPNKKIVAAFHISC